MRTRLLAVAAAALLLAGFAASPAEAVASKVKFGKITYDPVGRDTGSRAHVNLEVARVKNTGAVAVTLTGWRLKDDDGHVYVFPRFILKAGKTVVIHTGKGTNTAGHLYWGSQYYVWNNDGDKATLLNKKAKVIDTCSWAGGGTAVNC